MIYRTYRAPTYKEAVLNAKMELGNDMYILGRKSVKEGGVFGLFRKNLTEITVAKQEKPSQGSSKKRTVSPAESDPTSNPQSAMQKEDERIERNDRQAETEVTENKMIMEELIDLKRRINAVMVGKKGEEDIHLARLLNVLKDNDFSDEYIESLKTKFEDEISVKEAKDPGFLTKRLKTHILDSIETSGPIAPGNGRPSVVVLVGPTGVGKTTTIAKLAASYGVLQKHKVEVFTIDSYRIAAVEQLGKYTELMQIPFTVINSREEFKSAVSQSKAEVIFVDTAGRSQKNSMGLAELRTILDGVKTGLDVHLVLAATTKWKDALDIMTRFNQLGYGKIIITKLDETSSIGSLISILNKDKKLSYFTMGQGVPDDLELAEKEKLLELLSFEGPDELCS
ncbi:MAG: flagellar biosynthesis protein FlhF [Spirochaetes bacterium]|nr:flagellar biosynthesis protein FlhF [Spirochaetota bacterium]